MKSSSTTDIVDALVSKGVLTEEEGKLISKGAKSQKEAQDKSIKGKLSISSALDNATLYGDIRVRHETRWATKDANPQVDQTRNRERYKITFGVKTETGNWYSDLAFAMGAEGRSDNATFGSTKGINNTANVNGQQKKEALLVKRAVLGWKPTEWLALEAGRIANPLYTTEMVWDKDLTFDGAVAKLNFKTGDTKIFLTGVAFQYMGDNTLLSTGADTFTNEVAAGQIGFQTPLTEKLEAKAAITYYKYGNVGGDFGPGVPSSSSAYTGGTCLKGTCSFVGTNNLSIVEVPAELTYKLSSSGNIKVYGDWVINTDADERARLANDTSSAKSDDTAWLLGIAYQEQADKKPSAGDYSAKIWWQETGLYALDPNAVDSDFFDSKINVKGAVFKGEYLVSNNVYVNMAYGHGSKKNGSQATTGVFGDTGYNFKNYDLLQLDLTYKF